MYVQVKGICMRIRRLGLELGDVLIAICTEPSPGMREASLIVAVSADDYQLATKAVHYAVRCIKSLDMQHTLLSMMASPCFTSVQADQV